MEWRRIRDFRQGNLVDVPDEFKLKVDMAELIMGKDATIAVSETSVYSQGGVLLDEFTEVDALVRSKFDPNTSLIGHIATSAINIFRGVHG